ncbi:hypothetical protein CO661_11885 [Sinorhizobium fredii]|uniref:Uncharacterized protein n=1 Tax=Rhizobium fredii TaxID=380 RepID=A0A2A6LYK5_RHIFR|nr:hypothetical protein [Sinorhizobium fredii]PDT47438.1 hypothetical protein CO661_11885 [Sinorhizobium fredii]
MFEIVEVHKITATKETGVYLLDISLSLNGEVMRGERFTTPDDPHGANPAIRQWMNQNPDAQVHPYIPPTIEQIREGMASLTARQFRLGLISAGLTPAQVTATIEAMPAGPDKETALIEWEYATTFKRTHPLIASVGSALGLTDEQIDTMWMAAVNT